MPRNLNYYFPLRTQYFLCPTERLPFSSVDIFLRILVAAETQNSKFRILQNHGKCSYLWRNITTLVSSKAGVCNGCVTIAAGIAFFIILHRWGPCWDGHAEICIGDCTISFFGSGYRLRDLSGVHGSSWTRRNTYWLGVFRLPLCSSVDMQTTILLVRKNIPSAAPLLSIRSPTPPWFKLCPATIVEAYAIGN